MQGKFKFKGDLALAMTLGPILEARMKAKQNAPKASKPSKAKQQPPRRPVSVGAFCHLSRPQFLPHKAKLCAP